MTPPSTCAAAAPVAIKTVSAASGPYAADASASSPSTGTALAGPSCSASCSSLRSGRPSSTRRIISPAAATSVPFAAADLHPSHTPGVEEVRREAPMKKRWSCVALCVLCAMYVADVRANAVGQPPNSIAATIADFKKRVNAYLTIHKAVVDKVGALDPTKSPKEIAERETALGEALRAARQDAKEGDILTPSVGKLFRGIIRTEFARRSRLALKNREDAQDELPAFTPMVNQIYPTTYPLATFPPALLKELPELPK